MKAYQNVLETIGNTPLVKLNKLGAGEGMANIYGKCEFLQPSGSLKDRMALNIVEKAEKAGLVKPGGTLVEATAGNTGLALAMVAAVKGYKSIFVMPDKFSIEKINMLKGFGSEVVITPTAVPDDHPESWTEVAKRIVAETPNSLLVNQFFNLDNVEAHYNTTGPELWEQCNGEIDVFIAGAGSGGTISGAGKYLKEKAKEAGREVRIVLMDPVGSSYFDKFYDLPKREKVGWKMEGVGNDFVPGCLDFSVVDEVRRVSDRHAFSLTRKLAREEGFLVGETSGAGLSVALDIAREIGPGKNIVILLCDSGNRYISKTYNDEWMKANGFAIQGSQLWQGTVRDILEFKGSDVVFAEEKDTIAHVAARMGELGISQMPVRGSSDTPPMMVHESDLLQSLLRGDVKAEQSIAAVAAPLEGQVAPDDDIAELEPLFDKNNVAVVVDRSADIVGIVSKIDVVKFLAAPN